MKSLLCCKVERLSVADSLENAWRFLSITHQLVAERVDVCRHWSEADVALLKSSVRFTFGSRHYLATFLLSALGHPRPSTKAMPDSTSAAPATWASVGTSPSTLNA